MRASKKVIYCSFCTARRACARAQTRTESAFCHEGVVHGDEVDLVDALHLELVTSYFLIISKSSKSR